MSERRAQTVVRGLEGVVVATSAISKVYDEGGLVYRGYPIGELAGRASYEEVAYLLWNGELPRRDELGAFQAQLAAERALPEPVLAMLASLPPSTVPMTALRTAVSMLAAYDPDVEDESPAALQRCAVRLVARMPALVAAHERLRRGRAPVPPRLDLGHAANFLFMLSGREPEPAAVRAIDTYLVVLADHGFTSSTFAARVTASTLADIYSAATTAVGTLKGRLHGGATQRVMEMFESIGSPERAREWVLEAIASKQRIMGIGHRVYKTLDPRARVLQGLSAELSSQTDPRWHAIAEIVAETAVAHFEAERPELRLYPNVDLFAAVVLRAVGLPPDQFTPMFATGRVAGWCAHVMEQAQDNRLIRPRAQYLGPTGRSWTAVDAR